MQTSDPTQAATKDTAPYNHIDASLRRLSNQLRVDFAMEVHGSGNKRKREPTRSIYEEAALNYEKDETERAIRSKRMKKVMRKVASNARMSKLSATAKSKASVKKVTAMRKRIEAEKEEAASAEISELDDYEQESRGGEPSNTDSMLMHAAAASLAQLGCKRADDNETPLASTTTLTDKKKLEFIERTIVDTITQAHVDALAAKDEAIKAAAAALAAKDELVKTQAAIIAMIQQQHGVLRAHA
jgi:hypothetical protein